VALVIILWLIRISNKITDFLYLEDMSSEKIEDIKYSIPKRSLFFIRGQFQFLLKKYHNNI